MEDRNGLAWRDGEIDSLHHLTRPDDDTPPVEGDYVLLHRIVVPDKRPYQLLICRIRGRLYVFSDDLEYFRMLRPDHLEWLREAQYGYALRDLDRKRRPVQDCLNAVRRAEILHGQELLRDRLSSANRVESGGMRDWHRPAAEELIEEKRAVGERVALAGDAARLRKGLGLSIREFAEVFHLPEERIRAWEAGEAPDGVALALLAAIAADPWTIARLIDDTFSGRSDEHSVEAGRLP